MAGDWIKMRSDLITHPKIVRMVSALKADKLRVIGGLHAVWCLFDMHSEDGMLEGYTAQVLDDYIGWPGFAAAMADIGWLVQNGESLAAPRFDEHNGQSAKRRASESQRKRVTRSSGQTSASDADKLRTREEKRREEVIPPTPKGEVSPGFAKFWKAWPATNRKQAKGKCMEAWKKAAAEPIVADVLAHVERMKASQEWRKEAGAYIPGPLVYLNQRRWEGTSDLASDWWTAAGFASAGEANNSRCYEHNAEQFRDGQRITEAA